MDNKSILPADTMPGSKTTQKSFETIIIERGKKIIPEVRDKSFYKAGFKIDKINRNFYHLLYLYFSHDPIFEKVENFSLSKGLLITGAIGSGKTISMRIFKNYKMIPTRHIIREFNIEGMGVLDKYGRHSFRLTTVNACDYKKPITICFDDLGLEDTNSKLYGNSANVMADILFDRYEMFQQHGMITHATTNLDVDSLKEKYGDRMMDRFKEMMNLVICPGGSLRK